MNVRETGTRFLGLGLICVCFADVVMMWFFSSSSSVFYSILHITKNRAARALGAGTHNRRWLRALVLIGLPPLHSALCFGFGGGVGGDGGHNLYACARPLSCAPRVCGCGVCGAHTRHTTTCTRAYITLGGSYKRARALALRWFICVVSLEAQLHSILP